MRRQGRPARPDSEGRAGTLNEHASDTKRILFGVTAHISIYAFLKGQLGEFARAGWHVHVVTGSQDEHLASFLSKEGTDLHVVRTGREPQIFDGMFFAILIYCIARIRPHVVVMGTPKMGVFGILASRVCRVKIRIFVVHGLRWEGLSGLRRSAMKLLDGLACRVSTKVVCVSPSVRERLIREGLVAPDRAIVLGSGSANGVDLVRFRPRSRAEIATLRQDLGLPHDARYILLAGRLTADKGLADLHAAWTRLRSDDPDLWLIVAGAQETSSEQEEFLLTDLAQDDRTKFLGYMSNIENVFPVADIHLMLSNREGLGQVILEAAACEVPTVAYAVTGTVDAIIDRKTGLLVPRGDVDEVVRSVEELISCPELANRLGIEAAQRVSEHFAAQVVQARWIDFVTGELRCNA